MKIEKILKNLIYINNLKLIRENKISKTNDLLIKMIQKDQF